MQPTHRPIPVLAGAFAAAVLFAPTASAYIGPGAGLTAIGTVIALIGGILLGIVGFVWYPVKRMLRRRRVPHVGLEDEGADVAAATDEKTSSTPATTPKQKT